MKDKKRIVIRFNTTQEYNKYQVKIMDFIDRKKIKSKNEAYKALIELGLNNKKRNDVTHNLIVIDLLKEINDRLKIVEPEIRLVYWGLILSKVLPREKVERLDLSKLQIPKSILGGSNE